MSEQEIETLPALTTQALLGAAGGLLTQVVATVVVDSLRQWDGGLILRVLQGILPRGDISSPPHSLLSWLPYSTDEPTQAGSNNAEFDGAAWIGVQDRLARHGVRRVRVRYDGRTDDGTIDMPSYTPDDVRVPRDLSAELLQMLEGLLPGVWNVGEGSHGEFVIELGRRTIVQRHVEHYLAARASRTQHTLPGRA